MAIWRQQGTHHCTRVALMVIDVYLIPRVQPSIYYIIWHLTPGTIGLGFFDNNIFVRHKNVQRIKNKQGYIGTRKMILIVQNTFIVQILCEVGIIRNIENII